MRPSRGDPPRQDGSSCPLRFFALTAGAFGIGVTEFVIMGLLLQVCGGS